ncbi:MAG: triple tyrosine motif-containing protein [Pedobacter sp.]|uniref:triple tyrosine motif-containing protein n=1 Tax=Pedobacter sp. TaxID=1411316 RepID=UPI002806E986|nr:triple tyrosine motif-containing protein [Pedobacter sp.]MDQ8003882.1 triple tyrosine motif-containing protein [Pedobacter sp.]
MKNQILALLLFSLPLFGFAQNPIGMPDIVNYDNTSYGGGTHNWDIQQDRNGVLYFANDEGLLTFDGSRWKIYPLPNKTIVRSVKIGNNNKIYAGGQGDFGYFAPDLSGRLVFHSLKNEIPEAHRSFADIWNVHSTADATFFRAANGIYRWKNNKISVFKSEAGWLYMGIGNQQIIAHDKAKGLLKLNVDRWEPAVTHPLPTDLSISSIAQYGKDSVLVGTMWQGLLLLHNQQMQPVKNISYLSNITNTCIVNNNLIGISTLDKGFYLFEKSGKQLYQLNKNSGLQNSSVLSLYSDKNANIWLGLADGISFIANSNAIKHINPPVFDNAGGHTSVLHNNNLYVGLSNGVYKLPLGNTTDVSLAQSGFNPVANAFGQAWGMNVVNGKLLLGRHEGAFEIVNDQLIPIATGKGYWNFLSFPQPSTNRQLLLSGNYNGISVFEDINQKLQLISNIGNFSESARFVLAEGNNIWVSHPYKGVYKITTSSLRTTKVQLYTHKKGLPSTFNNHIYFVKNKIVVGTEKGVYEYNSQQDRFEPSSLFNPIFGNKYIRYLKDDAEGNIWFIEEKKLGVAQRKGNAYELLYITELNGKTLGGFEHINIINKNNIIIGAQKGFYHLNLEKYLAKYGKQQVRISLVKAFGKADSLLFGGYFGDVNEDASQSIIPKMRHALNSFHFEYSSTFTKNSANTFYTCYLKGFDENWSPLDKKTEKDYTNLPGGNYTFMVKTVDNLGNESIAATYEFTVFPPWYQSIVAYIVYMLMFFGIMYIVYKRQHRKIINQRIAFQREQEHTQYMHQLEIDKSDKEIIKLKNEKLELEIETKNTELASNTMHLVQKADLMSKIKGELFKLKKEIKDDTYSADFNKIIRLLNAEEKSDESWEQFTVHFDKVHVDFLKHLKEAYPAITSNELRLSAYLKMNLSTKEIAKLMKISPRGVEIGRYRLRKKLNIDGNVNLFEFFNAF